MINTCALKSCIIPWVKYVCMNEWLSSADFSFVVYFILESQWASLNELHKAFKYTDLICNDLSINVHLKQRHTVYRFNHAQKIKKVREKHMNKWSDWTEPWRENGSWWKVMKNM